MRFSTIMVYTALAIGLALAGPTPDVKTPAVEVVDGVNEPKFDDVPNPSDGSPSEKGEKEGKPVVIGDKGKTVSKRGDYNPLDGRGHATLILCPHRGCRGYCYGYNLKYYSFDYCYWARHPFYSAYVSSYDLDYGVYAGNNCDGYCYGMFSREIPCPIQHCLIPFVVWSRCLPPPHQQVLRHLSIWRQLVQRVLAACKHLPKESWGQFIKGTPLRIYAARGHGHYRQICEA